MAISLSVFTAQVDDLLTADNTEFPAISRYRQIKAAVERYSNDRPDEVTEDESGDAGKYYPLTGGSAVLASWVEDFSRILQIEYPAQAVADDEIPQYLEPEDWDDRYRDGSNVLYLFLPNHAPAATETMRIKYTVPYAWTASSTTTGVNKVAHGFSVDDYVYQDSDGVWYEATDQRIATHQVTAVADVDNFTAAVLEVDIPIADFFAVCHLAAGLSCYAIAAKYSRTSDSTIAADSVGHTTRAQEFRAQGKRFMDLYLEHMGLLTSGKAGDGRGIQPAEGDFVDWDTAPGWPHGRDYLFHGKGTR